jgi:alpha-L-rhamnosidase
MIHIRVVSGMRLTQSVAMAALLALSPGLAQSKDWSANSFSTPNPVHLLPENLVPTEAKVCPVRIVSTSGSVENAEGVLCNGVMGTTISVSPGSTATIVLDYGRNVGGIPYFDVASVSGSIELKASYSETDRYLGENGDGSAPPAQSFGTGEGDPRRYDSYVVEKAGLVTNYYNQGGQRYQLLTVRGSGTLTLKQVGITYIADRTQPANYGGYFHSNDEVLNRVWYASVYTAQLGSVPARSMPGGFRIVSGAMEARGASNLTGGSDIGYYIPGKEWTDYTMTMQASIVNSQAGWAVRAQDPQNGIVFILDTKGQLRALAAVGNNYKEIGSATVPFAINEGTWYNISTTVQGSSATVNINGQNVLTVDASAFSKGSIGFREYSGEVAQFRNVVVSGGAKVKLPFNKLADLKNFWIPGSNERPAIMDGAKRDRLIWSGDIDIAGPSISYSLGNNDYLKGSLEQMALRQHTSGFVEGAVPATYPLIAPTNLTSETGPYSATYSMYFVLGAYDHLLFSGDRAFAKKMWPIVQKQLAWNATRLDNRGLFITRKQDGADWDFYDAEKAGAITEYNAIYYRCLTSAAAIGDALGETDAAANYRAQAESLAKAINNNMYNSEKGYYKISDTVDIIAQDANAAALFAGLAPSAEVPRILESMKNKLWTTKYGPLPFGDRWWKSIVSTFISGYEAQARYASNDVENAETLIRNVFGWMVNPDNPDMTSTMWENIATDGTPGLGSYTSLAHGWATGAVSALSGYTLGIRPLSPGFDTWLVQPHPGTLTNVEGRVPTPKGPVDVKWIRNNGQFLLTVEAPQGTSGKIGLPLLEGEDVTVMMDGKILWQNGKVPAYGRPGATSDGKFLYIPKLKGGIHTVIMTK